MVWNWKFLGTYSVYGSFGFSNGSKSESAEKKESLMMISFLEIIFVQWLSVRTFGGYLFVWGQFCVFLSSGSNTRQGGQVSKW